MLAFASLVVLISFAWAEDDRNSLDKRNVDYQLQPRAAQSRRINGGYFERTGGGTNARRAPLPVRRHRPNSLGVVPPYAVQMEPLVQYSQRDPLYHKKQSNATVADQKEAAVVDNKVHTSRIDHDAEPSNKVEVTYGGNHEEQYEPSAYHPHYYKEPEPIIEIIIKESNETLPTPAPSPVIPIRPTKEPVEVFYVKYRKNPNYYGKEGGEEDVIYEPPIPALTAHEDKEVEPDHSATEELPALPPAPLPATPSTTLRTIIRPDSEVYHGSGLRVTFGNQETDHAESAVEEQSAPEPSLTLPTVAVTAQNRGDLLASSNTPSVQFKRQPPPYFQQPPQQHQRVPQQQQSQRQHAALPPTTYHTLPAALLQQQGQYSSPQQQELPFPRQPQTQPPFRPQLTPAVFNNRPQQPLHQLGQQQQPFQRQPFQSAQPQQLRQHHFQQSHNPIQHQHQRNTFRSQPQVTQQVPTQNTPLRPSFFPQDPPRQPPHFQTQQPTFQQLQSSHQAQALHEGARPVQAQNQFSQPINVQPQDPFIQHQQRPSHVANPQQSLLPLNQHQQNNFNTQYQHNPGHFPSDVHDQPTIYNQQTLTHQPAFNNQHQHLQQGSPVNLHHQSQNQIRHQALPLTTTQPTISQNNQQNKLKESSTSGEIIKSISQLEEHQVHNPFTQAQQVFLNPQQVHSPQSAQYSGNAQYTPSPQTAQQLSQYSESPQSLPHTPAPQLTRYTTPSSSVQYSELPQSGQYTPNKLHSINQANQQPPLQTSVPANHQPEKQRKQPVYIGANQKFLKQPVYSTERRPTLNPELLPTKPPKVFSLVPSTTPYPDPQNFEAKKTSEEEITTTKEAKKPSAANLAALPDEVPEDLREQLLASGILSNADIQILDYDKVGDIPIENLPPEALENFYGASSDPVPAVAVPPQTSLPAKAPVEMKVVRYDANTSQGQSVAETYVKEDATRVDPVVLNDSKYNRYLPLKVSGSQFPLPDIPQLQGRIVTSVVVLAPVDYDFVQPTPAPTDDRGGRAASAPIQVQGVRFVAGDVLKDLVKEPTTENYRRWLEKEKATPTNQQSVVLLVTSSADVAASREIFMYDVTSGKVSKLRGELSTAFVEVAESNAQSQDLDTLSSAESASEPVGAASERVDQFTGPVYTKMDGFADRDEDLDVAASEPELQLIDSDSKDTPFISLSYSKLSSY